MMLDPDGNQVSDEVVQEMIRETIRRTGRFILDAEIEPPIGQVAMWAGLPFRVVRLSTYEEHLEDVTATRDIWGDAALDPAKCHFEVEVAD